MKQYICPARVPDPTPGHLTSAHEAEGGHGPQEVYFKMTLSWKVFHDAGYLHGRPLLHMEDFSHGRFIPKIPFCGGFCQYNGIGFYQGCERIPLNQGEGEHLKYIGIGQEEPLFIKLDNVQAIFTVFEPGNQKSAPWISPCRGSPRPGPGQRERNMWQHLR